MSNEDRENLSHEDRSCAPDPEMTRRYLAGELSLLLTQVQPVTTSEAAGARRRP